MMKIGKLYILGILATMYLVSGCLAVFENPLPMPTNPNPDPKLLGNWSSVKNGEYGNNSTEQITFCPRSDGWMDVFFFGGIGSSNGVDLMPYEGYSCFVEKHKFVCLRGRTQGMSEQDATNKPQYIIACYKVGRRSLEMRFFGSGAGDLIEAGELEGTVVKEEYTDTIIVTASSEKLVSLISSNGPDSFCGEIVMKFSKSRR